MTPAQRVAQLRDEITAHAKRYYDDDAPIITDDEYNELFRELEHLERTHPELLIPTSPTQVIMGKSSVKFKRRKHQIPMLSLRTETEAELSPIDSFMERIKEWLAGLVPTYCAEPKYDGVALSLTYKHGVLVRAVTRGDGLIGEDVTHTAETIETIPKRLKGGLLDKGVLEVRGEAMMQVTDFVKLNEHQLKHGLKVFANPRNAAAGTIRQLDPEVAKHRKLIFVAYTGYLNGRQDNIAPTQSMALEVLNAVGFVSSGFVKRMETPEELAQYHQTMLDMRHKLPFEVDGVVYKVNEFDLQERMGFAGREPRWAIAHKFQAETKFTELMDVEFQIGRTGKFTPVARLMPVTVGGAVVSNATLSNIFEIRRKHLHRGDMVVVRRAGDVIPEVVRSAYNAHPQLTFAQRTIGLPRHCPVCDAKAVRDKGEANYYCTGGVNCPPQRLNGFLHFVQRKAMNIVGFGDSAMEAFLTNPAVTALSDIYTRAPEILARGVGPHDGKSKVCMKLMKAIEVSRVVDLNKLLFGLGIRHVGEGTSSRLCRVFPTINDIAMASYDTLQAIPDIGPTTASSIYSYFNSPVGRQTLYQLTPQLKISNPLYRDENQLSGMFTGLTFAVTGGLPTMGREAVRSFIQANGGEMSGSVGKKTNFVVVGEAPSPEKVAKAEKLGIPILSEEGLLNLKGNMGQ